MPAPGLYDTCPHCQEAVPAAAWVCSHCRGSLAVDVRAAPVHDPRERYRLARALAALGPPFPDFVRLQQQLGQPQPVLARRVTRAAGFELARGLEAQGLDFELRPSDAVGRAPGLAGLIDRVGRVSTRAKAGAAVALVGLATLAVAGAAWLYSALPLSTAELARRGRASTVVVANGGCTGSGFYVSARQVLTNAHVICDEGAPVTAGGSAARVVRAERNLDLALLEVGSGKGRPLPLGDAAALEAGDAVVLVGAPVGLAASVHTGRISNPHQALMGVTYLQLDANVNPGNSGGPLLNQRGEAIGIVTAAVRDARHIGLALPINYAYQDRDLVPGPRLRDWRGVMKAGPRRFLERVEEAQAENRKEVERFARAFLRPGLVAAAVGPEGETVAVLLRRGPFDPGGSYQLRAQRGNLPLCDAEVVVERWMAFEPAEHLKGTLLAAWIESNDLAADLFVGPAQLPLLTCRGLQPGDRLVLSDADPEAVEAVLEADSDLR